VSETGNETTIEFTVSEFNGVFLPNKRMTLTDIRDGVSSTIFVGERSSDVIAANWLGNVEYSENGGWYVVSSTNNPPNSVQPGDFSFDSMHPGIAVLSFVDGSVHNISEDIDQSTFAAMGTLWGGELVSDY